MENIEQEIYSEVEDITIEDYEDTSLKIKSMEDAVRYAYGLSKTKEELEKLQKIAQAEIKKWEEKIEQVKHWLEAVSKPLNRKAEYLTNQLKMYHMNMYFSASEKEKKRLKSIKLPYNITLKSRELPPKLEIIDEEAYIKYAQENGYLKPPSEPEVDWKSLKKDLVVDDSGAVVNKETGERLDFIYARQQDRKFEVEG